ncbi:hypothetical protein GYMLUDRAFT_251621 [Collybiopsis luxurians FD-317 M1]|uniref:Phosphomethylpyrimidine kinase n=1 Tax=Collybiopsis luxurians FD-317 M1 TaxID=944289 RepID=A0A0D0ANW9_9AGAR|nr:hypothetical protein GYMLUDRAFT_251621 [Collybiopsis luxurians FD-317 M1]
MASSTLQPPVLTIAGSDSSGGAGIQADLKTFAAHGCYGTSAITALTAQNTTGVQDVFPSSPEFLEKQIISILSDIDIKAIKTGMLFDADNTRATISALKTHYSSELPPLVIDPVCVSTSGHTLLDPDAIAVLCEKFFPLATLVTPNKAEAELLLSRGDRKFSSSGKIETLEDMLSAAKQLSSFGSRAVLLKGGHLTAFPEDVHRVAASHPEIIVAGDGAASDEENMEILRVTASSRELVVDVLYQGSSSAEGSKTTMLCRPRIDSTNIHGTGCTLSAAIASELALGSDIFEAVRLAARYTHLGIETADPTIGHGHGPLNHFHSMEQVVVPRITPTNPYPLTTLLIRRSAKVWKAYVEHDFVKLLGKGVLPKENFVHFIKIIYILGTTLEHTRKSTITRSLLTPSSHPSLLATHPFPTSFSSSLLAAKSSSFSSISSATETILNIIKELDTHKTFCATWGVSEQELVHETREETATAAYGGYLVDAGLRGDTTMLLMALLSCLLGYGEVGLWLKKNVKKGSKNDNDDGSRKGKGEEKDGWVVWEGNPYLHWMEDYSGESYQQAVRLGLETIEACAAADPASANRFEEWFKVWERCTEFEKGFWDMAMNVKVK